VEELPLEMLKIILPGLVQVFMALMLIGIKGSFGMSWLAFSVGVTYLGVLGVILMSPGSIMRDIACLVHTAFSQCLLIYSLM